MKSKLTRRDTLNLGMAAGAMVAVGSSANADTPKQGGRLRIGLGGASSSDTLDPILVTDTMAPVVSQGQTRNNLIEVNNDGELVAELAETWEPGDGGKTWRFRI